MVSYLNTNFGRRIRKRRDFHNLRAQYKFYLSPRAKRDDIFHHPSTSVSWVFRYYQQSLDSIVTAIIQQAIGRTKNGINP